MNIGAAKVCQLSCTDGSFHYLVAFVYMFLQYTLTGKSNKIQPQNMNER